MDPAEVLDYLDYLAWNTPWVPPNINNNSQNFSLVQPDSDIPQDLRETIYTNAERIQTNGERIQRLQASLDDMCTELQICINKYLINKSETPLMHPEMDQCTIDTRNSMLG